MKPDKYKLHPVLRLREQAQQDAARELVLRRERWQAAEAELQRRILAVENCRQQQAEARQEMIEAARHGIAARHLLTHRTHIADLKRMEGELLEAVSQQQEVVRRTLMELERARNALLEAAKELQVIEKHHEAWQQRTRREQIRREQKANDELGMILHTHFR